MGCFSGLLWGHVECSREPGAWPHLSHSCLVFTSKYKKGVVELVVLNISLGRETMSESSSVQSFPEREQVTLLSVGAFDMWHVYPSERSGGGGFLSPL